MKFLKNHRVFSALKACVSKRAFPRRGRRSFPRVGVLLVLGLALALAAPAQEFIHPGGLFKQSDMDRMRFMVQAGLEPWTTSFNQLKAESRASFNYAVQGNPSWTVVNRDPCNHCGAFESDVTAAYLNALMWIVTQDPRHADKCVQIFNTWKNLTTFTGGGTEALNAGLFSWKLVEAAEIIKSTYPGWSASDIQQFKDMLVYPGYSSTGVPASVNTTNGTFYWRIYRGDSGRHGNQDLIAWRAMITMGVFLDNRKMYDRALRYFKGLPGRGDDIPMPTGPRPSGSQIADNEFFTTYNQGSTGFTPNYGYNGVLTNYVWENGQNQESSRDQQHAFFGVGICAGMAEVAWNQGEDVWNSHANRLLLGFEFMARYNTSFIAPFPDQPTPWEPDNFIQRKDRTGRWLSKKINPYFESNFTNVSRGDFPGKRPVYEQAVAHFQVRMALTNESLWTERSRDVAIAQSGYERTGWSLDHPGWGALTFRRPPLTAGDPISGFSNGLPVFAVHALPGTIPAVNYDFFPTNGNGRTYYDLTPGNSGGQYRNDAVDIASDPVEGFYLADLENGEWITYTVNVPTNGNYRIRVRYAATSDAGAIRFAFGTNVVTGDLPLPPTGGMTNWETHTAAASVLLKGGVQALRVFIAGASQSFNLKSVLVDLGVTPPGVSATASNATVLLSWTATPGAASYQIQRATLSGGPYSSIATNDLSLTYHDTGLNNGTTYYYVVQARGPDAEPLAESLPVAATPTELAQHAIWTNLVSGNASGSWGVAANWLNGNFASGTDITANFSLLNLTAFSTVSLNGARTVGHLIFGDTTPSHDWALNTGTSGPLTLSVSSGPPGIQINNQTTTIGAVIAGTGGFAKLGAGTLVLTNTANSFSGNITITQGVLRAGEFLGTAASRLVLGAASSGGANIITVNSGATFQLAANNQINNKQLFIAGSGAGGTLGAFHVDASGTTIGTRWGIGGTTDPYVTLNADATIRVDGIGNGVNTAALLLRSINFNGNTLTKTGSGRLNFDTVNLVTGNGTAQVAEGVLSFRGGAFTASRNLTVDSGAQAWITGDNNAINSTANTVTINGTLDLNARGTGTIGSDTTSGSHTLGTLQGGGVISSGSFGNTGVNTLNINSATTHSIFDGTITTQNGTLNLAKGGAGTILSLAGNNSYNGTTVINAGALLVNGTHTGGGAYTVNAGGSLGGTGTINAPVTVMAGATLAPGAGIGTLTINGNLTLSGNVTVEIDSTASPPNDHCVVAGSLINAGSGSIHVANLGPALVAGDSFQLFNQPLANGGALAITPAPGPGLYWTNKLAVDGSMAVLAAVATEPTELTYEFHDNTLILSWPASHLGWRLEAQTNALGEGISTDWFTISGSSVTNQVFLPINPANGSVFLRLIYP